nr:2-amino-4-hydroxy-6-hydroxymethyldihydropteridine diphosphokinase [Propionibacterium sp.]
MTAGVHRFAVGLGANLGDAAATLIDAVARLAAADGVRLTAVSSPYRTAPVGGVPQDDFLNAVVVGETTLPPLELLRLCRAIEDAHHRTRDVRWGPRTLDLDVLVHGDVVSTDPGLTLPHPRAHERAFVLVPWLEADAEARLPGRGRVADLLATVGTGGVRRVRIDGWPEPAGRADG